MVSGQVYFARCGRHVKKEYLCILQKHMNQDPEKDKRTQERPGGIKPYVKYSGMAFQMIGALVLAALAGRWLDGAVGNQKPWFTISLLLVAVIATMVLTILSINKK